MSPLLNQIMKFAERLRGAGGDGAQGDTLRRLIHSPLLELAVKATPNKADDAALMLLRELFPLKASQSEPMSPVLGL